MNRVVDVVVTDGFTGNVALKSTEGTARAIWAAQATKGVAAKTKLGGLLLKKDLSVFSATLDPEEYGGALLGMNDPVVIAHGNARARGIGNAVLMAGAARSAACCRTIAGSSGRRHRLGGTVPKSAGGSHDAG